MAPSPLNVQTVTSNRLRSSLDASSRTCDSVPPTPNPMASSINLTGSSVPDIPLEDTAVQHEEVVLGHNASDQMQQPLDSSRHLTLEARRDPRIPHATPK